MKTSEILIYWYAANNLTPTPEQKKVIRRKVLFLITNKTFNSLNDEMYYPSIDKNHKKGNCTIKQDTNNLIQVRKNIARYSTPKAMELREAIDEYLYNGYKEEYYSVKPKRRPEQKKPLLLELRKLTSDEEIIKDLLDDLNL